MLAPSAIRPSLPESTSAPPAGEPGSGPSPRRRAHQHVLAGGHQRPVVGAVQLVEQVKALGVVAEQPGGDMQPLAGMGFAGVAKVRLPPCNIVMVPTPRSRRRLITPGTRRWCISASGLQAAVFGHVAVVVDPSKKGATIASCGNGAAPRPPSAASAYPAAALNRQRPGLGDRLADPSCLAAQPAERATRQSSRSTARTDRRRASRRLRVGLGHQLVQQCGVQRLAPRSAAPFAAAAAAGTGPLKWRILAPTPASR